MAEPDWGDHNWFGSWNAIVGMVVDPVTGDLYVAARTEIYRISPSQVLTLAKSGFTSVNGIDISRSGPSDPGVLLVADGGTSNAVKAVPLDNIGATPITVASASTLRAATFGATVSGGPWLASNVNRMVVIHNNGSSGAVGPLRAHPLVEVTPGGPLPVWVSSPVPNTEQKPLGQSVVRPSTHLDFSYSQALTELRYVDGLSRLTCAWIGDPGASAPQYEQAPVTPANCSRPRLGGGTCDNFADIVVGGPGSFVESGNPLQSCKTCGGTGNPCRWDFRITNRYAGDNYQAYFALDSGSTEFVTASDTYTAWKHLHVERERMCAVGGLLFQSYGATGQCGGANQPACCGTGGQPPCNQLVLFDSANVTQGDTIVAFDEVHRFEDVAYTRTVSAPPANNGDGSMTVVLDSPLPNSVWASNRTGSTPLFSNGHSGGVCVPSLGFDEAETSQLDAAYGDTFVSYHVPTYGLAGSGTVPRYWKVDYSTSPCPPARFSNIWFQNFTSGVATLCPDGPNLVGCAENNYVHVLGAGESQTGSNADTQSASNLSYAYTHNIALGCDGVPGGCTADKLGNMLREAVRHELGHQLGANKCTDSPDPRLKHHDTRNAWCGEPGGACVNPDPMYLIEWCPMHVAPTLTPPLPQTDRDMRADGIDHFCPEDLILGDPNCASAGDGALRREEDPQ